MSKKLVQDFYKSDAVLDANILEEFIHPEIIVDWHSSKGFLQLRRDDLLKMANELSRAYIRSKVRISHILSEANQVSVRYSHYVKTIENPREEMLLAHFMVIWEIKDGKLFRGYQMSQLS